MKAYFLDMFAYDNWANQLVLSELVKHDIRDEKVHHWLNHIVNAEKIWFERIQTGSMKTMPWEEYPLSSLYSRMHAIHEEIMSWLRDRSDEELAKGIAQYTTTQGEAFQTPWIQILAHVVNHSTHHRGQVVARMREQGIAPPSTDYIFFLRSV